MDRDHQCFRSIDNLLPGSICIRHHCLAFCDRVCEHLLHGLYKIADCPVFHKGFCFIQEILQQLFAHWFRLLFQCKLECGRQRLVAVLIFCHNTHIVDHICRHAVQRILCPVCLARLYSVKVEDISDTSTLCILGRIPEDPYPSGLIAFLHADA